MRGISGLYRDQSVTQVASEAAFFGSNCAEQKWSGIPMKNEGGEPPTFLNILLGGLTTRL
jgi:hypothetical protein